MWPITWFTVVASFLVSAVVADSAAVEDPPLLPSQDPWYDQPENIASFSPGQLIRAREVPAKLQPFFSSLPADISVESVHQYLFRTTDSIGDPVAAVVTLIEPSNADPNKLLAYQAPYDSASPDCSPSYTIQDRNTLGFEGFQLPGTNISTDIPFVSTIRNIASPLLL